jgi:transglutaminase-like putative cysteine protease
MNARLIGRLAFYGFVAAIAAFCFATNTSAEDQTESRWWSDAVDAQLEAAKDNRTQIAELLNGVAEDRRAGAAFLVENMPERDLRTLSAKFLLEDLNLAYDGWQAAPWHDAVSEELFLSDVLPYVCTTEARDPWRAKLAELCKPLVAECRTPGEAALALNEKLFPLVKVRYDTARRRPDQSPAETMKSGIATCTGLSILLVDACRSVGVPARVVGTPMWANMRGNHTWVEAWDGDWHFLGAAEPDKAGLDHGWFLHDASQAKRDEPRHAIYATSFRQTGLAFPMVWSRDDDSVQAVNVTDRYAPVTTPTLGEGVRLAVKVTNTAGVRVIADILVTDAAGAGSPLTGKSRDETADLNNLATFSLTPNRTYRVHAALDHLSAEQEIEVTAEPEQLVTLVLAETTTEDSEDCLAPVEVPLGGGERPIKREK